LKDYINKRVIAVTEYIIKSKATVRVTAKIFNVSKSTIHKDVSERIAELNPEMHKRVKAVLDLNLDCRHIRGGEATKRKYRFKV
jgi:putative DeoR family transcriptional regulator (stage III sporulation protein D)